MTDPDSYPDISPARKWGARALDVLLVLCILAAGTVLVLLHGFRAPPWPTLEFVHQFPSLQLILTAHETLTLAEYAIAAVIIMERLLRMAVAVRPKEYIRENWIDYALVVIVGCVEPILHRHIRGVDHEAMAQGILELYIVFAVLRAVKPQRLLRLHPVGVIAGGFIVLILAGAGLLMLPTAVPENSPRIFFIDALFTSTGAMCATCLPLRDTAMDFTAFGQAVIIGLVQIGGFAFMLLGSCLALSIGRKLVGRPGRGQDARVTLSSLAGPVATLMLVMELVGAAGLFTMFYGNWGGDGQTMGAGQAIWYSVFHSVSVFCNAGFTLYSDSMSWFRGEWQVLGVMMPLVILGGLGYPLLSELWAAAGRLVRLMFLPKSAAPNPQSRLSQESRTALSGTWMLIVFGALVLMLLENVALQRNLVERAQIKSDDYVGEANWSTMSQGERFRESVVQSISARSAGVRTLNMHQISDGGKMTLCGLMLVGGTPGGTAGGVKIPMAALLIAVVGAGLGLRNRDPARPAPPAEMGQKAVAVVSVYLLFVAVVTLLLCVSCGSRGKFMDCLFESCSACGSVGLSTGLTPTLGVLGKSTLIGAMFAGRLGPVLLLWTLARTREQSP